MRRTWLPAAGLVLLCWATLVHAAAEVGPATARRAAIVVTTLADVQAVDGECSLREAILNANGDNCAGSTDCACGAGHDTITFSIAGTIPLSSPLPAVEGPEPLSIIGPAGGLTLDGGGAHQILEVSYQSGLTVENLTLMGGRGGSGAAIVNRGTLLLRHCTLADNHADRRGGAIHAMGPSTTAEGCQFSDNRADGAGGGGAIYASGGLRLAHCQFDGNRAAESGGAISCYGRLTISDCRFSNNHAEGYSGGAINVLGATTIADSAFVGNHAGSNGGAVQVVAGGSLAMTRCGLRDNHADDGGGALLAYGGPIEATNCSFLENQGRVGGAIGAYHAITAAHCTFAGNSGLYGGHLYVAEEVSAALINAILAPTVSGDSGFGAVSDGGNNIDSGHSAGFGDERGSLTGTDPLLEALGADALWLAPLPGSPAIDGVTWNAPNGCPATDQRGYSRDGTCDIGAIEAGGTLPTATPTATASPTPTRSPTASPTASRTATASITPTATRTATLAGTHTPTRTSTGAARRLWLPVVLRLAAGP